jgi:ribose/xylose/arabinose/galactoside ABC-type transport system permease subunit
MEAEAAARGRTTPRAGGGVALLRLKREHWRVLLPAIGLLVMLLVIFWVQPRAMSYFGLKLLLNFSLPLVLASMAQLCIIAASDIDLGVGPFIALVNCIAATWLAESTLLGVAALALCVAAYAAMGALIHARRLPSIVVTLGASFVWLGIAVLILPTPGGAAPAALQALVRWQPPWVPLPILVAVAVAVLGHVLLMRTSYGVVLRGIGANPRSIARAGWSLLTARVTLYAAAGFFAVLAGLALTGLNTTGDANVGTAYTLLSIAAVIIGGGEFFGGVVSPVGAVIGSLVMLLTGSLLSFINVSTDWQLSVQGLILIAVLAGRTVLQRVPR